ncbi:MAG: hypothetical protein EOO03_07560 [Chitinophagaceae bacterium]|nr:MAG: hypothetical protein EOO03_07560 [Chitinophagaceae bacterium]
MTRFSLERSGSAGNYETMLNDVAMNVRSYMMSKYNEGFSMVTNEGVILSAMVLVPFEANSGIGGGGTFETRNTSYSAIFDCVIEEIGAVLGIHQMVSNFISLWHNGASISTVSGFAKNIFKTAGGWFLVGWAVYEFGECLGLW